MNLCKYRNIFGAPKEGIHGIRVFNLAVVDILFTIIGAYTISLYTKYSFLISSIGLFSLGIFFHYIFCVETTVSKSISKVLNSILL